MGPAYKITFWGKEHGAKEKTEGEIAWNVYSDLLGDGNSLGKGVWVPCPLNFYPQGGAVKLPAPCKEFYNSESRLVTHCKGNHHPALPPPWVEYYKKKGLVVQSEDGAPTP